NIDENLEIDKPTFQRFIKRNYIGEKKDQMLEKTKNIDFSKANPRNNTFMNELAFAGESISEGFLECFNIERKKAVENYKKEQILEITKNIDFSKANPRNNTIMNELAFAGESISEGFLECFNIERKKAVENYKNQLHVIESKEDQNQSKYYIGAFKDGKLNRLTQFQKTKDKLVKTVEEKNKKILKQEQSYKNQEIENQREKERSQSLQRERKEEL